MQYPRRQRPGPDGQSESVLHDMAGWVSAMSPAIPEPPLIGTRRFPTRYSSCQQGPVTPGGHLMGTFCAGGGFCPAAVCALAPVTGSIAAIIASKIRRYRIGMFLLVGAALDADSPAAQSYARHVAAMPLKPTGGAALKPLPEIVTAGLSGSYSLECKLKLLSPPRYSEASALRRVGVLQKEADRFAGC